MVLQDQLLITQNSDAQLSLMGVFRAAAEHFANLENIGPLNDGQPIELGFEEPSPHTEVFILNLMLYGEGGFIGGKIYKNSSKFLYRMSRMGQMTW